LKVKISNTADNADISQSQARDTRHSRMHELNNLSTDSAPLRAEYCIVASYKYKNNTMISKPH